VCILSVYWVCVLVAVESWSGRETSEAHLSSIVAVCAVVTQSSHASASSSIRSACCPANTQTDTEQRTCFTLQARCCLLSIASPSVCLFVCLSVSKASELCVFIRLSCQMTFWSNAFCNDLCLYGFNLWTECLIVNFVKWLLCNVLF